MAERRGYQEQERYWDGHSFRDNCPTIIEAEQIRKACAIGCLALPYIIPVAIVETVRESRVDRNAYRQLKEFLTLMPEAPVKNLAPGEIFDPKNYPLGTVLRIAKASEGERHLLEHELWGLVVQDQHKKDIVVAYQEKLLHESGPEDEAEHIVGVVEMGKVIHMIVGASQILLRYDKIEVWQYGHGIRERAKEKSTAPKGFLKHA